MKKYFPYILFILFVPNLLYSHKFYLTVCNIEHKNSNIVIELKFFMDDFEIAMINESFPPLLLGTEKENVSSREFIEKFIRKHLKIRVNDETMEFNFDFYKASRNCYDEPCNPDLMAVWCNISVRNVKKIDNFELFSDILLDHFPDHKMVCKVNYKNQKKHFILDNSKKKNKLDF